MDWKLPFPGKRRYSGHQTEAWKSPFAKSEAFWRIGPFSCWRPEGDPPGPGPEQHPVLLESLEVLQPLDLVQGLTPGTLLAVWEDGGELLGMGGGTMG